LSTIAFKNRFRSLLNFFGISENEEGSPVETTAVCPKVIRGEKNEERALRLTEELFLENILPPPKKRSRKPYRTEQLSVLDREGYDIMVPTDIGEVGIQIKSSYNDLMEFHRRGKGRIPAVVVNNHKKDEGLKIELASALHFAYQQLKERASTN
jgi:hypothetical protein